MNNAVDTYIENAISEHREIMELVRSIIHQNVKNITEEFKWSRPIFKTNKDFAYFQNNKNYVTIGFTKDIEKLNDPNKLLEGQGKTMRHIKVKKVSEIDKEIFTEWFLSITSN